MNTLINPLGPIDAYLHEIIECVKGPLTHICVKGEGVRFNRSFGSCKWAFWCKPNSPLSTFWLHLWLPWPLDRQENKRQSLRKAAELLPPRTDTSKADGKLVRG